MYIDKIITLFFTTTGTDFISLAMAFLIIVGILLALLRPIDF